MTGCSRSSGDHGQEEWFVCESVCALSVGHSKCFEPSSVYRINFNLTGFHSFSATEIFSHQSKAGAPTSTLLAVMVMARSLKFSTTDIRSAPLRA